MHETMNDSFSEESATIDYEKRWHDTWSEFNRALRSTDDDFNAFQWTCRLLQGGLLYVVYFKTGLYKLNIHEHWQSLIPGFAFTLIILVVISYYTCLRSVIAKRWCCLATEKQEQECPFQEKSCFWIQTHDILVAYLGFMIIFHFMAACFRSPGVALSKEYQHVPPNSTSDTISDNLKWSSKDSKGGCCCLDPILNVGRERRLEQSYLPSGSGNGKEDHNTSSDGPTLIFPDIKETFCDKCVIQRPPRCHHCSQCNRCILQYDHHCVWLNNCVGYNNYRNFFLTLFYLTVACWYGSSLLFYPLYEPLKKQLKENGWQSLFSNKGLLKSSPMLKLISDLTAGTVQAEIIIQIVFPLLVAVGLFQTIFFSYHVFYTISALTTLEHKILQEMKQDDLREGKSVPRQFKNPFSKGIIGNLVAAVGPLPLVFVPALVDPAPITLPENQAKKKM